MIQRFLNRSPFPLLVLLAAPQFCLGQAGPPAELVVQTTAQQVGAILDELDSAAGMLKKGQTGSPTRDHQQRAVTLLDQLIDAVEQSPPAAPQRPQSNSPQNEQSEQDPQDQRQATGRQQPGASPQESGTTPSENARDSEERTNQMANGAAALRSTEQVLTDVWGHLPPAVREKLASQLNEEPIPAYESLIRRFYRNLVDESARGRSSTPGTGGQGTFVPRGVPDAGTGGPDSTARSN